LIRKLLSLKEGGYQKRHIIRLNPIFVTNTKGAQAALDALIVEGRKLLADHYLAVETTYKKAIQDMASLGRGSVPMQQATATASRITTSSRANIPLPSRFSSNVLERGSGLPNV
jgi:hypothetical protein